MIRKFSFMLNSFFSGLENNPKFGLTPFNHALPCSNVDIVVSLGFWDGRWCRRWREEDKWWRRDGFSRDDEGEDDKIWSFLCWDGGVLEWAWCYVEEASGARRDVVQPSSAATLQDGNITPPLSFSCDPAKDSSILQESEKQMLLTETVQFDVFFF